MGAVLRGPTGQPLGCLSIMDTQTRYLSAEQRSWLVTFGLLVQELIISDHALIYAGEARTGARSASLRNRVTGLPEHTLFLKTLKHLVGMSEKGGAYLAILFLRINKIDEISRVHGRPVRDAMLHCLGDRLSAPDTGTLTVGHLDQASFAAVVQLPSLVEVLDVVTPISEKNTRLCRMLTEWSLTTVCRELPKWPFRPEDPAFRIAVNIPPSQFRRDTGLSVQSSPRGR